MSELPDSGHNGTGRPVDSERDAELADLLTTLDEDSFIPVAALNVVAEILTYLHGKDSQLAEAETDS